MPLYDTTSLLKNERNLKEDLVVLAKKNPQKLIQLLKQERTARMKAEELSEIDDITELLLNKRGWKKYTMRCANALIEENFPFAIFFIDLDRLKAVDDLFTNYHGTLYIQIFAEILNTTLRPEDIKSHPHGDEFFVLLPNISLKEAKALRNKLIENFHQYVCTLSPNHSFYEVPKKCDVGASIGIGYKEWGVRERDEILQSSEEEREKKLVVTIRETRLHANVDSMKIKKKKKVIREEARRRNKIGFISRRFQSFRSARFF